MSDTPQGPGWWLASDGRWYPPESAPAQPPQPPPAAQPTQAAQPAPTSQGWPAATAPGPDPGSSAPRSRTGLFVALGLLVVVVLVAAAFLVLRDDGTSGVGSGAGTGGGGIASGPVSGPDERPSPDITLTDETVVVAGQGGATLRSIGSDGSTFTLDGSADGVEELRAGSVLLLTGVLVVKVTSVERVGDDVIVGTEPAAIGDLIVDGELEWSGVEAGAGSFNVWEPSDDDVQVTSDAADDTGDPGGADGGDEQSLGPNGGGQALLATTGMGPLALLGQDKTGSGSMAGFDYSFSVSNDDGKDTYELTLTRDAAGLRSIMTVDAVMESVITDGRIAVDKSVLNALQVKSNTWEGKAVLTIEAATGDAIPPITTSIIALPISVDYPIVVYGIPFNLNVQAKLLFEPAFTSRNSTMSGRAEISFGGSAGLTYEDGSLSTSGAITASAPDPMQYIDGLGIGATGMVVAAQVPRLGFGLGWASSNAGVFLDSVLSAGVTIGSSASITACYAASITYSAAAGAEAKFLGVDIGQEKIPVYTETWDFVAPDVPACRFDE